MKSKKKAVVVIDMQREFIEPGGASYFEHFREVVEPIRSLLERARSKGAAVIHVCTVWRRDGSDASPHTTSDDLRQTGLRTGAPGAEIIPQLTPLEHDHVVVKKRYSAFYMTDLELLLRSLGCAEVAFVGVATNFCVRASVVDAANRDFEPVVLSDCVAGSTEQGHLQTLEDIELGFGKVMTSSEFLSDHH